MTEKFTALTPELHAYIVEHGARPDRALEAVEASSVASGAAIMQIASDQGAFITLLVRAIGARRALELGTFTGYGAISIARGLPDDGKLISCELEPERAEIAARHIREAGLDDRVEIRVGPGLETVRALAAAEDFDFSFIDADKQGYPDYYEEVLARTRPGGLIMLDNVLLGGRVLEPDDDSARTIAALNDRITDDERVDVAMLGIADGVTLVRKR